MEEPFIALMVPTIVFLLFVAPVWIYMHYRSRQRAQGELSTEEREQLEDLSATASRMLARIETLESILDGEAPGWRAGDPDLDPPLANRTGARSVRSNGTTAGGALHEQG